MKARPDYIVKLPKKGGFGVLVGDFIVTAAHCVDYSTTGGMVLGDHYIEEIQTSKGEVLKVGPWAVEPCSDIAVLGALDGQTFYDEAEAFENFCEATKPVRLARGTIKPRNPFPVRIHNKNGQWVKGTAQLFDYTAGLCIIADEQIESGASGGPILNTKGELVAICSNCGKQSKHTKCTGSAPRPLYALPVWICQKLL